MSSFNLLAKYDNYILQNASSVTSIESTLRTLTYLLPGRFQDSEAASELLYASLNLLGTYHDSILARALEKLPNTAKKPQLSAHNRYTKFWTAQSNLYMNLSVSITTLQHLSFLFEIIARKKFGEKARWRTIICIEALKAFCRFILLQETKSRPLVFPHVPEREVDPTALEESLDEAAISAEYAASSSSHSKATQSSVTINGTCDMRPAVADVKAPQLKQFSNQDAVTNYLLKKVLYVEDLRSPKALLHTISGRGKVAEVLFILRPLIYATMLSRSKDKRNWRPWLVGIAIDYAARELTKQDFDAKVPGGLRSGLTKLEKEEMKRRNRSLGWWLLRGAFYENVTKPRIDGMIKKVEKVPLLGLLGNLARDYEYWYESYFTTASI